MMKKLLLIVFFVMSLCMASNAYALSTENWQIDIAKVVTPTPQGLYDRGTIYSLDTTISPAEWVPLTGYTPGALSLVNGTFYDGGRDGVEDTWGIFRVSSIVGTSSGTIFDGTTSGDQIVGYFYGFDDAYLKLQDDGIKTQVYAVDGRVELWRNNGNFDSSVNLGTGGKTVSGFTGITQGSLLLAADAHVQTVVNPLSPLNGKQFTFSSLFNFNEPFGGSGEMYLDVDSSIIGSWTELLNTDGYLKSTGSPADIYINFSSDAEGVPQDWTTFGNGQGNAKAIVPEPASMTLLGLGLAGLARLRRRVQG